jgi:outer membrane lipoprotein-sorting protein
MKKIILTLGTVTLLASPCLFATEDNLQEHLRIGQQLQLQQQKRLKDGSGEQHQYKYQHQHQYQYHGTNPNSLGTGSMGGQKMGGGRH